MRPTFVSSVRSSLSVSSLEEVESAFLALAAAPWPLSLPGSLLTGSAADALPVTVVRARLVHPSCTAEARARVWCEVLGRRQKQGEPWGTVAVGLTVPGLRRVLARLRRPAEVEACELEQEVLAAVCTELAALPVEEPEAGLRLLRAGDRAAHRLVYAAQRARRAAVVPLNEETVPQPVSRGGSAEVFAVLEKAVHAGVLGEEEAELIAQTRVERQVMAKAAEAVGMSVRAAFRRRSAAEQRLAAALAAREL
ncbi:hypothetical protein ACWDBP_00095 [Streptomyces sp. NPDC001233]|uniref:hypothetical protein n=1 Tax=Streptomyces sp. NPDC001127 TaxID=3154377 RepID=UPI00331C1D7A